MVQVVTQARDEQGKDFNVSVKGKNKSKQATLKLVTKVPETHPAQGKGSFKMSLFSNVGVFNSCFGFPDEIL